MNGAGTGLLALMGGMVLIGIISALTMCVDAHAEVFVNDKQVSGYSVTYKANGEG